MTEQLENQPVPTASTYQSTPPKVSKKPFVMSVIKSSLILALALFMLISAFAPIVKMDIDEIAGEDVSVGFGTIDGITMLISSAFQMEDDEVSEIRSELTKEMSEYFTDWENGEELGKFSEYTKKTLHLFLRSEDTPMPIGVIFVSVFSIAQIVLAVLLAVFAALSFASVFTDSVKPHFGLSFLLLGLNTIILPTNAYAFTLWLGDGNMKLSGIAVFTIIFAIAIMIAFFVLRLAVDREKIKASVIVKHALSLTFAIVVLASAFAPIVTTEIKTTFENSEDPKRVSTTLDGSLFSDFALSETDKDEFDALDQKAKITVANEHVSSFSYYTSREFKRGDANGLNTMVYTYLLLAFGAYEYSGLFTFGTAAMILTLACALVVIWQNLHELATGKRLHISIALTAKIVAIVMAVAITALAIVMSSIVTHNAGIVDVIYKSKISYGPILMLICAITMVCIPPAEPKAKAVPTTEV